MNKEKTNIYTLFLPCYSSRKNEILNKLQESCKDANFIGFDELSGIMDFKGAAKIYQNIRKIKDTLDGILIFGGYLDNNLTSLDLPIIMVRALLGTGDWEKGILNFYKDKKVLTVSLSDVDKSLLISSSRVNDLLEKIKLIIALKKLKIQSCYVYRKTRFLEVMIFLEWIFIFLFLMIIIKFTQKI